MTAYYGTNTTKRRATPPQIVDTGDQGGRIRHSYDEIATTTAMANADTVGLGLLPVGARVVGIQVSWAAHATGRTLKIGDAADDDRFLASTSIAAAGTSTAIALAGCGYRNTTGAPVEIVGTIGGGTLAAASPGITCSIRYVMD